MTPENKKIEKPKYDPAKDTKVNKGIQDATKKAQKVLESVAQAEKTKLVGTKEKGKLLGEQGYKQLRGLAHQLVNQVLDLKKKALKKIEEVRNQTGADLNQLKNLLNKIQFEYQEAVSRTVEPFMAILDSVLGGKRKLDPEDMAKFVKSWNDYRAQFAALADKPELRGEMKMLIDLLRQNKEKSKGLNEEQMQTALNLVRANSYAKFNQTLDKNLLPARLVSKVLDLANTKKFNEIEKLFQAEKLDPKIASKVLDQAKKLSRSQLAEALNEGRLSILEKREAFKLAREKKTAELEKYLQSKKVATEIIADLKSRAEKGEFAEVSQQEAFRVGFFINMMNPAQKTDFTEQLLQTIPSSKEQQELILNFAKTGVLTKRQSLHLLDQSLQSANLTAEQREAIRKPFTDGTIDQLQTTLRSQQAELTKKMGSNFYKNSFDRLSSKSSILGMLGIVWGFLTASLNLIANRGRPNEYAAMGFAAMLGGAFAVQTGSVAYKPGFFDSTHSAMWAWLVRGNKKKVENMFKKQKNFETFAQVFDNENLHGFMEQGGFGALLEIADSRAPQQKAANKVGEIVKHNNGGSHKFTIGKPSFDTLMQSPKITAPMKNLLRKALASMPGSSEQAKKDTLDKLLTDLIQAARDTGKISQKGYKLIIDYLKEVQGITKRQKLSSAKSPSNSSSASTEGSKKITRSTPAKTETAPQISGSIEQRFEAIRAKITEFSAQAGVSPGLVAKIMRIESNFNPNTKASSSSARGLGQFIDETWIEMVLRYGKKYGITGSGTNGEITAADAKSQRANIDLQIAMTAEFTKHGLALHEKFKSANAYSEDASVYAHHNLGLSEASKLLQALRDNPTQRVEKVLQKSSIRNNPSLYKNGQTVAQVYEVLVKKMQAGEKYAQRVNPI
jgi:hypothetical protein